MGADRRGPLAAFVVVAIIAAVLLVTSVRSQAAGPSPLSHHVAHPGHSATPQTGRPAR